jgi:glycosyltransferase involved in cell wall biosynthesis
MTDKKSFETSNHKSKKTILQVVPTLVAGGVERGTIEIAKAIINSGDRSIVVSAGGPLISKIHDAGAEHFKMNVATKNPVYMYNNIDNLSKIIKEESVDIVHARSRAPAWSAYYAAKKNGTKFMTTFHGVYNFNCALKKYYNSIMVSGERVIAVSHFIKDHILANYTVDEDKVRVVHRGVDYRYFDPTRMTDEMHSKFRGKYHVPKSVPIIVLPARMTRWKGHTILIKALNLIKDKDFYCIISGDLSKHPAYTCEIRDMIHELKLQRKIQLFGPEIDMLGLYGIADIVLSTSIEPEAFGRVAIEGQAMEKVVIATNIGGAVETVTNEVNGYHVKPSDEHELASKISYVLDNLESKNLESLRKKARQCTIDNFSVDTMDQKTMAIYAELA